MKPVTPSKDEFGKLIAGSATLLGASALLALLQTSLALAQHRAAHHDVALSQIAIALPLCLVAAWAGTAGRRKGSGGAAVVLAVWGFAQTACPRLLYVSPLPPFVHLLAGAMAILAWTRYRRSATTAA